MIAPRWIYKIGLIMGLVLVAVFVLPAQVMKYVGTEATVLTPTTAPAGVLAPSMRLAIQTTGSATPLAVLNLRLQLAAKKWPAGVVNAKVFYTGTKDSFSTASLFGLVQNKNGQLSVNGEQGLQSGSNYFWLTIELKPELKQLHRP